MVSIPGFPLTLGRVLFVFTGFTLIIHDLAFKFRYNSFIGFFLIFIGLIIASLKINDQGAITKSIAFLLLFFGSIGNARLWGTIWGRRLVDGFFISLYLYWTMRSLGRTLIYGYTSYSDMFIAGDVINHHVPGMLVSVAASYIVVRFFYSENRIKTWGYLVFFSL